MDQNCQNCLDESRGSAFSDKNPSLRKPLFSFETGSEVSIFEPIFDEDRDEL